LNKSRRALLLNDILNINLIASTLAFVITIWMISNRSSVRYILLAYIPCIFIAKYFLRREKVAQAAYILVFSYLSITTLILAQIGTILTPVTSTYLLGIVLAALILDHGDMLITVGFTFLATGALVFFEQMQWTPDPMIPSTINNWLAFGAISLITAISILIPRRHYLEEINTRLSAENAAQKSEEELRKLYSTAQRQAQELALLDRVRLALAREMDLKSIIRTVVESVAETFGYTLVSLYLLEDNQLTLQHQVGYENTIDVIPPNVGVSGRVIQSHTPVLVEEVQTDPDFLEAIQGIVSEVCVPLFDQGQVAGILNVESTYGVKLTTADLQLMTAISEHVSIAIGRARLYQDVRISEERYRTLADAAPDLIYILSRESKLMYINKSGSRQLGLLPEHLIGRNYDSLLFQTKSADRYVEIQTVFDTRQPFQTEDFLVFPDHASWFDTKLVPICDVSGNATGVLGIGRDITERKENEAALKQRAQELAALNALGRRVSASLSIDDVIEATIDETVPIVMPDLTLLFLSEGDRLVLHGHGPQDSPYFHKVQPIQIKTECLCGLAIKSRESVYSLDLLTDSRCDRDNCSSAGIRSFAALPLFAENEIIGVLGFASATSRDFRKDAEFLETISNQVATGLQNALLHEQMQHYAQELERRVSQRTAELEAKNRELETFSYSVSHDLKAPLRGIDGYSQLLAEDYSGNLDAQGRLFLENIRYGINRMNQLIDDLLAYSRLERRAVTRKPVYLKQMVQNIASEWLNDPNNRAKISFNVDCQYVMADSESLTQALRNLIDNAIKFTRDVPEPSIEIGGAENDDHCVMWVRDNGIGFDMQYADRIFEIFQRLNRVEEYPGTGIGLAMVRKAIERVGGRTWTDSAPGRGATFFIEIPKNEPPRYSG